MTKVNKPKYSIVMGAINEEDIIQDSLLELKQWLVDNNIIDSTEVVVVTAEGKDQTIQLVSKAIKEFKHAKHLKPGKRVGKGRDIMLGMKASTGQYVLYMDADLATPLKHIKTMLKMLVDGDDVVIGQRDLSKMHNSMWRRLSSQLSNLAIKSLLWQNFSDTQCGFKGFSRQAADDLFSRQTVMGWGFDYEILAIAKALRYKIVQFQIPDWKDPKLPGEGLVGDSEIKTMIISLKDLISVRKNLIFRKYD